MLSYAVGAASRIAALTSRSFPCAALGAAEMYLSTSSSFFSTGKAIVQISRNRLG